ncbi:MAG: flagellar filament capping protein FliD [Pseudomonadota bacterium]
MASIQALGVGSGLLTSDLVEDIIAAEREATDLRLDAKRAEFDARISAFGAIRSSLDTLNAAADRLGTSSSLLLNTVTSTDDSIVTATVGSSATPGIHTVEVQTAARAHTLTSVRYDSIDQVVGDGTLDIRFGTTTFVDDAYDSFAENPERGAVSITIDSSNNTLDGIRDAINTANAGVQASIVNDGEGFILVLKSDQTGADHSLEITATEGATAGLSALSFNAAASTPGTNFTQSVAGQDAAVVIDGINITRETNTIDQVIPGVVFNVLASSEGKTETISVSQDVAAITENVQTFVDEYNALKSLTDELTEFDEDDGGALLTGDSTVRSLTSQLRRFLSRSVGEVESNSIRALVDIGISTNQNNGFQLAFNSGVFQQALATSPDDVLALLADQSRASDSQISFLGFQSGTAAGSYAVNISQASTQAQLFGATTPGLDSGVTIDDDNDTLSVTVDGVASGVITLAQASYTDGAELAQELETQINLDSTLSTAGRTVEVSYDTTLQQLVLTSTRFGSASTIGIDTVDTNTESQLGLAVNAAVNNVGVDVQGTVNGLAGTGTGQFLSIPSGPVAAQAGVYQGTSVATLNDGNIVVDATNNTFRVSVDGTLTEDVVLTNATYSTAAELASEIQSQINADANLSTLDKSVTVAFDAANSRFTITSPSAGAESSVNLTFANAGAASALGLTVGVGQPGRQASSVADPAAGIQLLVQGTEVGERGTVTLVRGVMNQIDSFLTEFTSFGGTLSNKLDSLGERVDDIDEEAADFSTRMDLLEERLRLQFAAADALISTLNNTSEFLDQQLSALPGFRRDSDN